jgi:hypothetical protein
MSASNDDSPTATGARAGQPELSSQQTQRGFAFIVLCDVRLILIALWLGAAVFFSFAVAPSAFAVLPARELAGAVVSRTLAIVNTAGFLISLVLLASAFLFKKNVTNRAFFAEVLSLLLIAFSTFAGNWIIATRLQTLRAEMGRPIDEIAQSDPLRIAFNNLHGYSVAALSIAMLAALVSLLLIARRARK